MINYFRVYSLIFLFCFTVIYANPRVDFLILGSMKPYTVYNSFEQPLTGSEKAAFAPGSPLKIINFEVKLGDQITHALRFSLEQKDYYLVKDAKGYFAGEKKKDSHLLLKGCVLLNDTFEVLNDKSIRFSDKSSFGDNFTYLKKRELLVRVFEQNGSFYVFKKAPDPKYGWCRVLSENNWRRVLKFTKSENELSSEIREQLFARMDSVNHIYTRYFESFNKISGLDKRTPRWSLAADNGEIRWILNSPYVNTAPLKESTEYLIRDLEGILLGKPFYAVYGNGEITIKSRK
jgi:hypothetical protein